MLPDVWPADPGEERDAREYNKPSDCPDYGVKPGELHDPGCDAEPCSACGCQAISCGCKLEEYTDLPRVPWSGIWPGVAECVEYGLFCVWVEGFGWKDWDGEPDASPSLTLLHQVGRWDRDRQRWFVKPEDVERTRDWYARQRAASARMDRERGTP